MTEAPFLEEKAGLLFFPVVAGTSGHDAWVLPDIV
jgi:hypothetical protein